MSEPAPATTDKVRPAINDCWNRIGVRGDASCPELEQHAHCRNCPVFATVAITLLDRDLPKGYAMEWMGYIAELRSGKKDSVRHSAILFRLADEWFAISTLAVDEITELPGIRSLPHRWGATVLGLANVQGELVVCVSLAKTLGLAEPDRTVTSGIGPAGRLMVVRCERGRIAFPVDEVQRTHRYSSADLRGVPATIARSTANYTKGILRWRDRMVGCLDDQRVIEAMDRAIR